MYYPLPLNHESILIFSFYIQKGQEADISSCEIQNFLLFIFTYNLSPKCNNTCFKFVIWALIMWFINERTFQCLSPSHPGRTEKRLWQKSRAFKGCSFDVNRRCAYSFSQKAELQSSVTFLCAHTTWYISFWETFYLINLFVNEW